MKIALLKHRMTPADEMEQIIKEIAVYDKIDDVKSYTIKTFPEICFLKYTFCYRVEILEDHRQSDDVIKRYEELRDELRTRKITFENKVFDTDNIILFDGNHSTTTVPIYYKDCVFASPGIYLDSNFENCIIEKG